MLSRTSTNPVSDFEVSLSPYLDFLPMSSLPIFTHDPCRVLTLSRTAADPVSDSEAFLLPDYSDIPNFDRVTNPVNVPPAALPLTIRMLAHVPLVVSSRRSQTSGSPTHVTAKLWVE